MKNKKIFYLALSLIIVLAFVITAIIQSQNHNNSASQAVKAGECDIIVKPETVRGESLVPLVNSGEEILVQYGYYQCRQVNRGDIIAYNFAGNPDPIIKIIKALPGDELKLIKSEESNCWGIQVNNEILTTSKNQPYCLPDANSKMLALYQGQIQENTYLLLGNLAQGSLDSTRFGLVNQTDILGKVVW